MNNPFLKRLMKDDKESVFHTSAYGRVQNDKGIGTASAEGFGKRLEIEKNRKVVGKYSNSQVANLGVVNGPRAKAYVPTEGNEAGVGAAQKTLSIPKRPDNSGASSVPNAPKVPNRPNIPRKRV